jgi:pimeloyl-ACP methyl ester carboxylesterase
MQVKSNYLNFCSKGSSYSNFYLETNNGIQLHVVKFEPDIETSLPPVVLLPGLASVIENFKDTVIALTQKHTVYFLETREKGSSVISGKAGFSIVQIASDLPVAIKKLGLESDSYILAGYSLGASVIATAYSDLNHKPMVLILIEPSATFNWPWWLITLAKIGAPIYPAIKPFLKWYMITFRINTKEDKEMYEINARILDQADPKKLALTVLAVKSFEVWNYLQKIDIPTLVIGVSQDKFHSHDEALRVSKGIDSSTYIDVLNNKRSHSAEVALLIEEYVSKLDRDVKVTR